MWRTVTQRRDVSDALYTISTVDGVHCNASSDNCHQKPLRETKHFASYQICRGGKPGRASVKINSTTKTMTADPDEVNRQRSGCLRMQVGQWRQFSKSRCRHSRRHTAALINSRQHSFIVSTLNRLPSSTSDRPSASQWRHCRIRVEGPHATISSVRADRSSQRTSIGREVVFDLDGPSFLLNLAQHTQPWSQLSTEPV